MASAAYTMGNNGVLSGPIADVFEKHLDRHHGVLRKDEAESAADGFKKAGRGSPGFLTQLETGSFDDTEDPEDGYVLNRRLPPKQM